MAGTNAIAKKDGVDAGVSNKDPGSGTGKNAADASMAKDAVIGETDATSVSVEGASVEKDRVNIDASVEKGAANADLGKLARTLVWSKAIADVTVEEVDVIANVEKMAGSTEGDEHENDVETIVCCFHVKLI
ncbi:hypothetical protein PI124_g11039 [Phytophthora idaei]|nr:hypothetical protein PI124_g11039 [Phytophthora idaei]